MRSHLTGRNVARVILAVLICLLPGFIGTPFTETGPGSWYREIEKPFFEPPSWVFGPVWTALYIGMGLALYLIWMRGDRSRHWYMLLGVFVAQLILNALWTPAFFGLESPLAGLIVITPLLVLIAVTIYLARPVSGWVALIFVPYLIWVSYASALNFAIWQIN
jgi:translocator protein